MYVSPTVSLYQSVARQIAKHMDTLTQKIEETNKIGFMNLPVVQQLMKVITSLLAFLATVYEFTLYCTTIRLSQIVS